MFEDINRIKEIASEMRRSISRNDPHRAKLQIIIDSCDEILTHYIDDGR